MSTITISAIFGLLLALIVGINQHKRLSSGANKKAIRNPDGSVYAGLWPTLIGVVILWSILGFCASAAVVSLCKWIF